MNDSDHWAKRALKHARVLSQNIGARGATSKAEGRAAAYVHHQLEQLGIKDAKLERFEGATSGWMPWALIFSLSSWGMLIGLVFGLVGGLIAAAFYAAATWIAYQKLYPTLNNRPARRWLWHRESQNVYGSIPPAGSAEREIVIMAYLDSARAPSLWGRLGRRRLLYRLAPLLFLSLPLNAVFFVLGAFTTNVLFYFMALLLLFPQIAALLGSLHAEHSPVGPGANHNASGVGTLLALAERLSASPLAHSQVRLLATGCRETGGDGMRSFLQAYRETPTDVTFIALEGVGVGEHVVYLTSEGPLWRTDYSPQAIEIAARAAARCREQGLSIQTGHHRGFPTEIGILVRHGFQGLGINAWPAEHPGVAHRHRIDDTPDTLQPQTLAHTHHFVWTLLQEIDRQE
jgi:hypothetical protein